ncbi:MAG: hypothetical protein N3F63_01015 [Thermoplasmata archaeon]|nr:hypothetical protein [Thermoplasmata archaeon]
MKVKEEREVRVILRDAAPVLASGSNRREYALADTYYLPEQRNGFWKVERRNLRLRKFGHAEAEIVLSVPEFRGIVKYGRKYFIASGTESQLAEMLEDLGFAPAFKIQRKRGYFLDYSHWNLALEEIDGIGWTIDADVSGEEDAWNLVNSLGENVVEVLKEPLPSYFCKTFNIEI